MTCSTAENRIKNCGFNARYHIYRISEQRSMDVEAVALRSQVSRSWPCARKLSHLAPCRFVVRTPANSMLDPLNLDRQCPCSAWHILFKEHIDAEYQIAQFLWDSSRMYIESSQAPEGSPTSLPFAPLARIAGIHVQVIPLVSTYCSVDNNKAS